MLGKLLRRMPLKGKLFKLPLFAGIGGVSLVLLGLGTYAVLEFTDSPTFCGRICHEPMYPEFTTYQASPHSKVACSKCHVGPGVSNLVDSKLGGVGQIFSTITGDYERPIPTPVENLRPANETCQ